MKDNKTKLNIITHVSESENNKVPASNTNSKKQVSDGNKILDLALDMAYILLISGAEMSRVDNTIQAVCDVYGAYNVEYFTYPRFIIITLDYQGKTYTKSIKIRNKFPDFNKLEKISKTYDEIIKFAPDIDSVIKKVEKIAKEKRFGLPALMIGYFIIPASLTLFFGGTFYEAPIAGLIGLLVLLLTTAILKVTATFFIPTALYSFVMVFLTNLLGFFGIVKNTSSMEIALLMIVVPGLLITNSMREFVSGEYLTGYSKLIEALLLAIAVALGVICAGIVSSNIFI